MRRITVAMILLLGMLIFPVMVSADGGLNVDVDILGNEPDVDIDIPGDGADVGVDVTGDNSNVWINGQNINQPTVVHSDSGGGVSSSYVKRKLYEVVDPLYSWAQETEVEMSLTMDGLAKLIVTVEGQGSRFDRASADVEELQGQMGEFCTQLREDLDAVEATLVEEQRQLALEAAQNEQDMLFQIELAKWEANRNLAIASGVFLLILLVMSLRRKRKGI